MKLRTIAAAFASAGAFLAGGASAQYSGDVIRIGFITDMSGVYADIDGPAGADAIRMAIADMGGAIAGKKIELLVADHQNKPDIAASKAREWFDTQGLDVLIAGTNSGTNLAMAKVAAEKHKPMIAVGGGTNRLTNEDCTPWTVHYAYDTVALANVTGSQIVKNGGKTWFFLTADYAFGASLEHDATEVIKANGGTVLGSVRHPLGASDFSSFLLQAQSSKAQILGLANAGGDTVNSIKAAKEFGINKTMKIAGAAGLHHRRPRARAADRAGPARHRQLVLGHQRPDARLVEALLREGKEGTVEPACGRLFGGDRVPRTRSRRRAPTTRTRSWRICAIPRSTTSS